VAGALLCLREAALKITCTDGIVAAKVRATLTEHGIVRGVHRMGPYMNKPTVWITVKVGIEPAEESTIRREIEAIAGATIDV
jgi:hypothetical protein